MLDTVTPPMFNAFKLLLSRTVKFVLGGELYCKTAISFFLPNVALYFFFHFVLNNVCLCNTLCRQSATDTGVRVHATSVS